MKTSRKNQKEMLEAKQKQRPVKKIKNGFDNLNNNLDTVKERISKLEDMSIEIFQTKMWRKYVLMEYNIQSSGTIKMYNLYII